MNYGKKQEYLYLSKPLIREFNTVNLGMNMLGLLLVSAQVIMLQPLLTEASNVPGSRA